MKGRVVAIEPRPDGAGDQVALMVDGRLEDLLIDPPEGGAPSPGAIYRGVLDRPMKGMGAATVTLGNGQKGFLRDAKGISPGTALLVQVTSHAEPGKAAPVTPRLTFKSRYAIVTPGAPGLNVARKIRDEEERERLDLIAREEMEGAAGLGLVLRTASDGADEDAIRADVAEMRALAEQVLADPGRTAELLVEGPGAALVAWRDWSEPAPDLVADQPGSFDAYGVWDAIDDVQRARVRLKSGWMMVEPTTALIAIDVNTGGDLSPAAGLKTNLAAIAELPRALRLRGLAGQITVDLAPATKKQRIELEAAFRRAFRNDPVETRFIGWTPLGHAELLRKRERLPLREVLA
ncbi:ribonuclease E/G [Pontivivens insulae]|uniref:Ribonuclease G n=1 Tax=Pontivivens insulae TaxID=1639689 RepID=A0A2R8AC24_9RHOB|nr:ribonuclease E/G [Pontivivens insulae]RED11192.1 Rne/Rng family ribonuclease [Pontivivens insulae]SPF29635.1 Ribonuclease G [Pontivivens insulae]